MPSCWCTASFSARRTRSDCADLNLRKGGKGPLLGSNSGELLKANGRLWPQPDPLLFDIGKDGFSTAKAKRICWAGPIHLISAAFILRWRQELSTDHHSPMSANTEAGTSGDNVKGQWRRGVPSAQFSNGQLPQACTRCSHGTSRPHTTHSRPCSA